MNTSNGEKIMDYNKRVLMGRVNRYRYCEIDWMHKHLYGWDCSILYIRNRWESYGPGDRWMRKIKRTHTRYYYGWSALAMKRLIGVTNLPQCGFTVETLELEYDGKLKDSVHAYNFQYKEFMNEEWENSGVRRYLYRITFLFVICKRDSRGDLRVMGSQCWQMPPEDIEEYVKPVWEKTKEIIASGDIWYVNRRGVRQYRFTTKKENPVCHIRDAACDNKDVSELPNGTKCQRRCFGLDNNYIRSQLNREFIEDELRIENNKLHIKKKTTT